MTPHHCPKHGRHRRAACRFCRKNERHKERMRQRRKDPEFVARELEEKAVREAAMRATRQRDRRKRER